MLSIWPTGHHGLFMALTTIRECKQQLLIDLLFLSGQPFTVIITWNHRDDTWFWVRYGVPPKLLSQWQGLLFTGVIFPTHNQGSTFLYHKMTFAQPFCLYCSWTSAISPTLDNHMTSPAESHKKYEVYQGLCN